jgi:ERCC4-type nuclease
MGDIELVIDVRERGLIEKLQSTNEIKVEQLDIGDIIFRDGDTIILVIERKTINDLKSSICDGRGREQKARLLGSVPKHRIMYLIEGSLNKPLDFNVSGVPVSTLIGSLVNTQLRDGIKVYKTASMDESVNFLRKLHDKLKKDVSTFFKDEEQSISVIKYTSSLKKSKKANMNSEVWFMAQLSLIPQVTEKVASEVIKVYPSVSKLILEYEKTDENLREKLLADLTFPINNGKKRRVGDKMSSRIYNFLYGKTD